MIVEIRRVILNYWSPTDYINRLDTPETIDPREKEKVIVEEKYGERRRSEIEAAYQKQKYWEAYPEEYKAFLAEEKRKKDELEKQINKLRIEIAEKSTQVEEMKIKFNLEIGDLRNEREKLGIFAGKQKKEIDEKINAKENDFEEFRNGLDNLKKYLQKLEE
jgi:chromosome segregation ATPase